MKNLILIAIFSVTLMARATSKLDLSSASLNLTGASTSSATPGTALTVTANTNGNVLVISTFSTEASIRKNSAEGIWQLKSTSQTSNPIKRSLENKADLGIASVVHVFTNVAVNETIALQHSSSDTAVTITTLGANLVAIPLTVSSGETLNYGLHQQSGTSSITDNGFVTTGIETSVDLPRTSSNRVYIAASFNSQATAADTTGKWRLEYRKGLAGTWTATGSEISRSMSTAADIGAVTLYGLVEELDSDTYWIRLVCSSDGTKTVQTLNGTLAVVALSYGDDPSVAGGHFDGFSVNSTSLNEVGVTPYTGAQASMTLASDGSIFASMAFAAVPTVGANQTGAFDLSTTIGTDISTSGNQENQRYFTSTTDYGSGGSVGYFSGLAAGTHSIYGRYEDVTGPINAVAVTLVGFSTEATLDDATDLDNDVGITKTVNDSTPAEGQGVQFTLEATNFGTNVATNVTVSDVLPTGLSYVSDNSGGSYNTGSGLWTVGMLLPGDSATLIIGATIDKSTAGSSFTNTASISTDSADENATNDDAEAIVTVQSSQPSPDCGLTYTVADAGGANGGNDLFTKVNRSNGVETAVGTGTGTDTIEAMAFNAGSETLYAADADELGTISLTTGEYTTIGSFGTGDGADGSQNFNDVDGLCFDPLTGILYGSVRREAATTDEDLLIQINPATGAHVPDAFGSGVDYVVINAVSNLYDIDDIAIDSYDGQMYAIANTSGADDRLVKIDKFTGVATDVGLLGVNDHEGLSFDNDGQLYGTTGAQGDAGEENSLYYVNKSTGVAYGQIQLTEGSDYESSESLICPPNRIEGTVFLDVNADAFLDNDDSGTSGVIVSLYRDANTNGVYDSGDILLATNQTASSGEYAFDVVSKGAFVLNVDTNTLPEGYTMTTDNIEVADFDDMVGVVESNNDFGSYLSAQLFGYLFEDEDGDQIRGSGDTTITNALVSLIVDGAVYSNTYTDADGYYEFSDVPTGIVTVQVVQADADLVAVPSTNDVMRNRAVYSDVDTAYIEYTVTSGYGVLAANPGEPLNFGYDEHPLSTHIDLRVYATSDGKVMIDVYTVNENGNNDIEIYAMINGEWVMVAMVPSEEIAGGGCHTYTVEAVGLTSGQSYMFMIVDESGHTFYTDTPVNVAKAQLRAMVTSLSPEYFSMTFNTEPFAWYMLVVSDSLSGDAGWTSEYVQVVHPAFPDGVSDYSLMIQGAPDGTTTLRVPHNRDQAFFKLIKTE